MVDDRFESFHSKRSLAYGRVAVLVRTKRVFAVVDVNGSQTSKADDGIEMFQDALEIPCDVVAGVADVAGVKADAEFFLEGNAVDYRPQLLEARADFAAFAGHRFQHNEGGLLRFQDLVQKFRYELYALLYPLPHVAAGMEDVQAARHDLEALHVVNHDAQSKIPDVRVGGAGIQSVRGVGQDRFYPGPFPFADKLPLVLKVPWFGGAAPGVPSEELEGRSLDGDGVPQHGHVPSRGRKMTAYLKHYITGSSLTTVSTLWPFLKTVTVTVLPLYLVMASRKICKLAICWPLT